MTEREEYTPGAAAGAEVRKEGDQWTLILVRELKQPPEKVWRALTDRDHLREWAPFDIDGNLDRVGTVKLTWLGAPTPIETKVTRVEERRLLEYGDIRWELSPSGAGTRLKLSQKLDRRFIAWGAAGWHIAFDVLERLLAGVPIGRMAGPANMQNPGWQRLVAEYSKQFGIEGS